MLVGVFGHLPFRVAKGQVLTFSNLSRDTGARWAQHDVIGKKPKVEYVGPELHTVSFTMRFDLSPIFNSPPIACLLKLQLMMDNKQYKTLNLGGEILGRYVIESIKEERREHIGGICSVAEVNVTLKEYAYGPRNYFNK